MRQRFDQVPPIREFQPDHTRIKQPQGKSKGKSHLGNMVPCVFTFLLAKQSKACVSQTDSLSV
jgi:hypothetical protein